MVDSKKELDVRLEKILKEVVQVEKINLSLSLDDIPDWDSLMQIELVAEHESHFGLRFGMKEVLNMKNVGEMIDIIEDRATK